MTRVKLGTRVKLLPPGDARWSGAALMYDERAEAGLAYESSGIIVGDGGAQFRIVRFDGETGTRKVRAGRVVTV